ncbi:MAG: hypothetical protein DI551_08710 [Micavibrio aeruginosavorus]|uniref:Uncharacterized protein n=1 Tax=Micavibrio aeruginosavorus TaxID=349221 RepID=A0A2W5N2J1_9BACT|nr:MAG: hypothetical protein DI551_08710 [Micavibrio aeruginosavorus]
MKKEFDKSRVNTVTDRRDREIHIDDICRIDFPRSPKLHGKSGVVVEIDTSKAASTVWLEIGDKFGKKKVNILSTYLIRTRLAEDTAEYRRVGDPAPKPKRSSGRYGRYYDASKTNTDIFGTDQGNYAVGDAFMKLFKPD